MKIPAQDYPEGTLRPIYASPENYPRYVGTDRKAEPYLNSNCEAGSLKCEDFKPIGYIPQVSHTFSYFEQTYGAMNEKQVGIAESTCSGVFVSSPVGSGGKALLSIDQLSQIALERSSNAREAIEIMGELAETFGFYGESTSFEGGSESLFVTDPNEAWAFHILADPTGKSAIWVAARVPDDSVAVVANMFTIRTVDLNDTSNFLGRKDMWEIAEQNGLYKLGDVKDFTATFSDGEYAHKYYSGRRMWGVFRLLAPTVTLSAEYNNLKLDKPYPFAVKIDKKINIQNVFSVLRDWYNNTEYSTGTENSMLAAGPFGSPDRYSGSTGEYEVNGNWERTIALFRSSDTYVIQSRSWLPDSIGGILWFGPHAAHGTVYVPIMSAMTQSPDTLAYGWQGVYNLSNSFWVHRNLENIAQIKFNFMIQDIRTSQNNLESNSIQLINQLSIKYSTHESLNSMDSILDITNKLISNANIIRDDSLLLCNQLLFKYADGNINSWSDVNTFHSTSVGYPSWWLKSVGYENGPPPPLNKPKSSISLKEMNQKSSELIQTTQYSSEKMFTLRHFPGQIKSTVVISRQSVEYNHTNNNNINELRICIDMTCKSIQGDMYEVCINRCLNVYKQK